MLDLEFNFLDWIIVWPIIIPIFAAAFLVVIRNKVNMHSQFAFITAWMSLVANIALLSTVLENGPIAMTMGNWPAPFGISFVVDTLSALFSTTASIIILVVVVYSFDNIQKNSSRYGFYSLLFFMQVGITGIFLTGDIFNMYVWLEVMLLSSFGLIVLGGRRAQLDAAIKYSFLNLIATVNFLIATGFLYGEVGTMNMADIAQKIPSLDPSSPIETIAFIYIVALIMKAGAFPLFFWLPASYHTPKIPVAAAFAGLLTKAGIYGILRVNTLLFPEVAIDISSVLSIVGILTIIIGGLGAIAHYDIRRIAGYILINSIGLMLLGLSINNNVSKLGVSFYVVHSMLSITLFYLIIGVVRNKTGKTSLQEIGGIYNSLPLLSIIFLITGLSIAGVPPTSGFWPKYVLLQQAIHIEAYITAASILIGSLIILISIGRIWLLVYLKNPKFELSQNSMFQEISDNDYKMEYLALSLLAFLIITIGLYSDILFSITTEIIFEINDYSQYFEAVLG